MGDNTNGGVQGGTALPFPPNMMPGAQSNNGAPTGQAPAPFVFTMSGQQTSDYTAVQSRLTQLETFAQETREAGRKGFVAGLVTGNKITAPQQPEFEAFALGLGDDQYLQWTKMWEGAVTPAILGNHGAATVTNSNNSAQAPDQDIRDAEQVIKMHQQGGVMTVEQIKQTKAYETLKSANRIPAGLA